MKVIKNALLYTMETINGETGYIAINKGKIEKIGRSFDPSHFEGYEIIDAKGKMLTPGLVEPHSHLGISEEGIQFEGSDHNETTSPVTPEMRGIDALYPNDNAIQRTLNSGITTVVSGPGSANVIGGTFTAIKTVGDTIDTMILKEEVSMKMALGENPKRVYSNKQQSPSTRMASAALAREWLMRAREYHDNLKAFHAGEEGAKKPPFDMKLHSLKRVFEGLPVKVHAHRSDDIMTAIRIADEFGLDMTIEHGTEAHLIAKSLKESGYPVILGPTLGPSTKYETRFRTFESARILDEHGVSFAIMTDHPVVPTENTLIQLALFVKAGLDRTRALEALTINAARLNRLDDRVGSLKEGKDADIVIWDGDILDIMTSPETVIVDGNIVRGEGSF